MGESSVVVNKQSGKTYTISSVERRVGLPTRDLNGGWSSYRTPVKYDIAIYEGSVTPLEAVFTRPLARIYIGESVDVTLKQFHKQITSIVTSSDELDADTIASGSLRDAGYEAYADSYRVIFYGFKKADMILVYSKQRTRASR